MTQVIYRKWRPQTFDEVVGQEHVTQTLRNALASGRVGHAYLFAGLRGTGKTTMARLLAKAVNCLALDPVDRPCNECAICRAVSEGRLLDLIEIDAASHTSVDDVRELRDKVGFRPNECRYKVYIIDEVHRFSGSAFDALLKTIEEPPDHAVFVLATTEIHKVPATILSRCQRFDFRRIPLGQIVQRLQKLAQAEGISIESEALTLIARSATGSLRDAESLLDQLAAIDGGGITLTQVRAMLGTVDVELVTSLVDSLVAQDTAAGLALINQVLEQAVDLRQFTRQVVDHLRAMLLIKLQGTALLDFSTESLQVLTTQAERIDTPSLLEAVKRFNQAEAELKGGWQPQLPLELALVEVTSGSGGKVPEPLPRPTKSPSVIQETSNDYRAEPESTDVKEVPESPEVVQQDLETLPQESGAVVRGLTIQAVQRRWPEVLEEMRTHDKSIQALLNSTYPASVQGEMVTLHVAHEFARAKLSQRRATLLVAEVLSRILGQSCQIGYKVASPQEEASDFNHSEPRDVLMDDPLVRAARDMGAEVRPID